MHSKYSKIICLVVLLNALSFFLSAQSDSVFVSKINIEGNKKTKNIVIFQELCFSESRAYLAVDFQNLVNQSKINLNNTSLFNIVEIRIVDLNFSNVEVNIKLVERWYIWPTPFVELVARNFSDWLYRFDLKNINYGGYIIFNNIAGLRQQLRLKVRAGYKEQLAAYYSIPYLFNKKTMNFTTYFSYFRQKEVILNTSENKIQFFRQNNFILKYWLQSLSFGYVHSHYLHSNINLTYFNFSIDTSITNKQIYYIYKSDKQNINLINFNPNIVYDKRNSNNYPTKGYLLSGSYNHNLAKNFNYSNLSVNSSYFTEPHKRFSISSEHKVKVKLNGKYSYYFDQALGYYDFVRGFEHYVIDGNHFYFTRNSIKFNIIPYKVRNFNILKYSQFDVYHLTAYMSVFFDYAYVSANNNLKTNNYVNISLYSAGFGIDIISYYDKIFRIECAVNNFGKASINFHIGSPIIF